MPKVIYIAHDGARTELDIAEGENVMHGALYNGVEGIVGECGGALACATCHCYIDDAWIECARASALERQGRIRILRIGQHEAGASDQSMRFSDSP